MAVKFKIQFLLFILLLILILMFPSGLKAEKTFRFGTWTYGGLGLYPSHHALMKALADTLKFNYLQDTSWDSTRFYAIQQHGLKIAAQNCDTNLVAPGPYYYSYTHYNIWEAEGDDRYPDDLQLTHTQGREVNDGGVISWMVSSAYGDTADTIQRGPYYGQDNRFQGEPQVKDFIEYSVPFRLRLAGADPDSAVNDAIAILSVTVTQYRNLYTVVTDTLWEEDFPDTINYVEDILSYKTRYFCDSLEVPVCGDKIYGIEFRIYWFGKRDLYIDKVTVSDVEGRALLGGLRDDIIKDHIYTYFEDSSSLDAWYMNEELKTGHDIDCFMPWRYVDSLLYAENPNKTGFAAMHDTFSTRYFVDLANPKQLHVDIYPLGRRYEVEVAPDSLDTVNVSHSSDYQGQDSVSLQVAWCDLIQRLDEFRKSAEVQSIEFSTTLQGFSALTRYAGDKNNIIKDPDDTLTWYYSSRDPTGYELECMTNLAIAHGSEGVLYWKYWDGHYHKTVWVCTDTTCDSLEQVSGYLHTIVTGLVDDLCNATERWYWIRDKIGPYIDSLGETYYDLTWLGAGSSDGVDTISGSFINDIQSLEYQDSAYIEVAFFDSGNTDYFMLVNRRCLSEESQNVTSYINKGGTYKIVDLYEDDTTLAGHLDTVSAIPFTTHLEPGEGKLFKLIRK